MNPEKPRRWSASWIWPRDLRSPNTHLLVRKDFQLDQVPQKALLHIAAESSATVYLNNRMLGCTSANSYPHQHYYESFPCEGLLSRGLNKLAVVVRYIGIPSSASIPKDPGLLAEFEFADVEIPGFGSDDSWKCLLLPAWLGHQRRSEWLNLDQVEILDHRLLPDGFPFPVDESGFDKPEALPWPGVRFTSVEPRPFPKAGPCGKADLRLLRAGTVKDCDDTSDIPALVVSEEVIREEAFSWDGLSPFTVPARPKGKAFALQLDLGNYYNGRPHILLQAAAGTILDIAWEEKLEEGRFDVRRTRVYTADRHILREGINHIRPEDWLAGRFLQLTFRNLRRPVRIERLEYFREAYPLDLKLSFRSSSPLLNRIIEISLQAVRRCMHDNIMDCPWRERRQWIGDVQRISLINHFAFRDTALVRGVLRQHIGMQHPTGRMWCCVPIWEEYPTQSMEWVRAVLEYTDASKDRELLNEVFPNILLLHRWFLRQRDTDGLFFIGTPPVMNWMDNPFSRIRKFQFEVPFLAQNLRYLIFLDDVVDCLARSGRELEGTEVINERNRLAGLVGRHFLDPVSGLLSDCPPARNAPRTFSEMGHALAICADLYPNTDYSSFWDKFRAYAARHPDEIIPCSPFGQYHVHQALAILRRPGEIVDDILAKWGPMVEAGADTTWEDFAGRASRCHGWAGIPVVSLASMVLGLRPARNASARVEDLGGVKWMEASISESE